MDDWQEAAFTSRHVHNKASKSNKGGGRGRRGGAFEVKRAFGRYDIKCPSATKVRNGKPASPSMDIFRLSEDGRGLLGQLSLLGVLDASIILTGSRKVLEDLISQFEESDEEAEVSDKSGEDDGSISKHKISEAERKADDIDKQEDEADEGSEEEEDEEESEVDEKKRFKNFEKNSFRSPKFWFQWNGDIAPTTTSFLDDKTSPTPSRETGRGYIVFSGNDCRSFKGTISCDSLGWRDVSISGWKEVSMSERDAAFVWK
ncbi:catalase [Colletotrichum scovillei]|uniref:Catalase n=1 Tax=Colletotrichum scovillei TaxID=1209932 RepID=A0A9P7QYG7_9PEZI|nr:catalase [Colletotrichum scovillei]KAF4784280.1 catalase [Colletotrichum scovillei]KAG7044311.1 catalase [Colletotrichum scovillei]KAG7049020.1 catalase [Colletotrichum scovillei]KAG7063764.1 catalase [Colletotrichum scovillei]